MRTIPLCTGALLLVALPAVVSAGPAGAAVPDATHTTFTAVTTDGRGCPAGSTNTSISDDGLVVTTTFSAYEATIHDGQQTATSDCRLTVKVHTPPGRSVTLRSFSASGYAFLEDGVRGAYQSSYTLGGLPVTVRSAPRPPFTGPHDDDFVLTDDLPAGDRAWTPCGTDHVLVITTGLSVRSDTGKGSGYVSLHAFDGSAEAESRIQERACAPGTPAAPATVPGATGTPPVAVRVAPRFTG